MTTKTTKTAEYGPAIPDAARPMVTAARARLAQRDARRAGAHMVRMTDAQRTAETDGATETKRMRTRAAKRDAAAALEAKRDAAANVRTFADTDAGLADLYSVAPRLAAKYARKYGAEYGTAYGDDEGTLPQRFGQSDVVDAAEDAVADLWLAAHGMTWTDDSEPGEREALTIRTLAMHAGSRVADGAFGHSGGAIARADFGEYVAETTDARIAYIVCGEDPSGVGSRRVACRADITCADPWHRAMGALESCPACRAAFADAVSTAAKAQAKSDADATIAAAKSDPSRKRAVRSDWVAQVTARADIASEAARMLADEVPFPDIAAHFGVKPDSLRRTMSRAGYSSRANGSQRGRRRAN